jgi:hypothetical protein
MKLEPVRPSRGPGTRRAPATWRAPSGWRDARTPWLILGALAVVAFLVIAGLPPDSQSFASRLAILVFGLLAGWRILGRAAAVTASSPERFEDALRRPSTAGFEIAGLRAIETDVRMATANAFGVELRLKPVLRELARWRLQRDHGVDLDRQPDIARGVLGEPLWRLVAPREAFPEFRAPGVALADIQAGIDRLERL